MNPYNASCGWSRGKKLMPITSCDSNQNCREQKFARSPTFAAFLIKMYGFILYNYGEC